jgi:type IV pilus assembly protein PilQ
MGAGLVAGRRHGIVWEYGMMSTTRGNELGGTPVGWLKAAGRTFALAIAGLTFALGGADKAQAQAEQPAGNQLQEIQVQPLAGNRIELRLMTSGPAPAPLTFTIDNPARISVDLPDTTLALPARRKDVKVGPLDTILAAGRASF